MLKFSIVIATHRRPALLNRALTSVKAQADGLAEIIVVSDVVCSETYEVASRTLGGSDRFIQRFGVPGPAASRNLGIDAASGENIIFLDDDDGFSPDYLQQVLPHLCSTHALYVDYATFLEVMINNNYVQVQGKRCVFSGTSHDDVYVKNNIPVSSVVYPRSAIASRRFDPQVGYEDWDFLLNVMSAYPLKHAPITGPIIFQQTNGADHINCRSAENSTKLRQIYIDIYRRWPAQTELQNAMRQLVLHKLEGGPSASNGSDAERDLAV